MSWNVELCSFFTFNLKKCVGPILIKTNSVLYVYVTSMSNLYLNFRGYRLRAAASLDPKRDIAGQHIVREAVGQAQVQQRDHRVRAQAGLRGAAGRGPDRNRGKG
jgi:hypothetical protein